MNRAALAIAATVTACAVEPAELEAPAAAVGPTEECDDFLCTGNSPIVGGIEFWRLDELGANAYMGFRIAQLRKDGAPLIDFDVIGARPQAYRSGILIRDALWIGAQIDLVTPSGAITVTVADYRPVDYYDGKPGPPISAFRLQYPVVVPGPGGNDTRIVDVCDHPKDDDRGLPSTWAILSQGDDFDKATTSITASGAAVGHWFNISCAGDVISKLLRMRHAYAVIDPGHPTTQDQRQAALRMFTAKYCDAGKLYTHKGQPLTWEDRAPWSVMAPYQSIEAIWGAQGAVCLSNPRLFPLDQITLVCPIQACTATQLGGWRSVATNWLVSANPL